MNKLKPELKKMMTVLAGNMKTVALSYSIIGGETSKVIKYLVKKHQERLHKKHADELRRRLFEQYNFDDDKIFRENKSICEIAKHMGKTIVP